MKNEEQSLLKYSTFLSVQKKFLSAKWSRWFRAHVNLLIVAHLGCVFTIDVGTRARQDRTKYMIREELPEKVFVQLFSPRNKIKQKQN